MKERRLDFEETLSHTGGQSQAAKSLHPVCTERSSVTVQTAGSAPQEVRIPHLPDITVHRLCLQICSLR